MPPHWQSAEDWNLGNLLFISLLFEQDSYHGVKIQPTEAQMESCALGIVFFIFYLIHSDEQDNMKTPLVIFSNTVKQ